MSTDSLFTDILSKIHIIHHDNIYSKLLHDITSTVVASSFVPTMQYLYILVGIPQHCMSL